MDFKQIEAFVNVVECKSFSKGAEATFLTQPTVIYFPSDLSVEKTATNSSGFKDVIALDSSPLNSLHSS